MSMAIPKVIPKKDQVNSTAFVRCSSNKPSHPVNGPGKTGIKEPISPKPARQKPSITKNISMSF